jgi:hypothetical protein
MLILFSALGDENFNSAAPIFDWNPIYACPPPYCPCTGNNSIKRIKIICSLLLSANNK